MDNQELNQRKKSVLKALLDHLQSPLYKNSLFLIIDSAVTAVIGFFFWILVARFYSAVDVGYGSAAISAISLLAMLSLMGFNFTIIRYLPKAENPLEMINSCLTLSGIISLILAVVFLLGLDIWSPALHFIKGNIIFSFAFIIFTLVFTLANILRFVFLANRRADLVLSIDTIQSLLKVPLAIFLVLFFHSFGIAAAWGIGVTLSLFLALFLFRSKCQNSYKPMPTLNLAILNNLRHYSAGSYIASLFSTASTWIMPIMVVNVLGSEQNAYFYVTWTISILLSAIPVSTSNSLFVEGSHFTENLGVYILKALKFTYILLIPAICLVFLLSNQILHLFGPSYSVNGSGLLKIMAVSGVFVGLNAIYATALRIKNKVVELCLIYAIQAIVFLGGSYFVLPIAGIVGIGYIWMGEQAITSLYVALNLGKKHLVNID